MVEMVKMRAPFGCRSVPADEVAARERDGWKIVEKGKAEKKAPAPPSSDAKGD